MTLDLALLQKVQSALAELGSSLETQNHNVNPAVLAAAAAGSGQPSQRFLEPADRFALRQELAKKSTPELYAMFGMQARKQAGGIPFDVWAASGGNPTMSAINSDPILTKALDTAGASALIRQDLEPILYELYIRTFPAWNRIAKEPANGLVHAYDRITAYGDAQFMTELGTVTDDTTTYERKTTPVSVIATRRGITLKSQFAVQAGGMGFNPEQLELQGGLRAIAHKMQKTIFQGNATTTGGAGASTELGAYDANAFDGLRGLLSGGNAVDVDPTAVTPEDMRQAINDACVTAMQNAGNVGIAFLAPEVKAQFDYQQDANVRYMNTYTDVAPGVLTNAVNTVFGPTPLFVIPGDSIGSYTKSADTVSDIYLMDESVWSIPYLGSDGPTVLDIPVGISGQLTRLFIIFGMWGMALKATQFCNKVRVVQP
jgi:hypothetical protein